MLLIGHDLWDFWKDFWCGTVTSDGDVLLGYALLYAKRLRFLVGINVIMWLSVRQFVTVLEEMFISIDCNLLMSGKSFHKFWKNVRTCSCTLVFVTEFLDRWPIKCIALFFNQWLSDCKNVSMCFGYFCKSTKKQPLIVMGPRTSDKI